LLLMAQACYDPRSAIAMWQRMTLAQKSEPPQYLSTHPSVGGELRLEVNCAAA
ncbi:hypothetical protein HDU93_006871, partial [Gonapodya sp. JEL0774]